MIGCIDAHDRFAPTFVLVEDAGGNSLFGRYSANVRYLADVSCTIPTAYRLSVIKWRVISYLRRGVICRRRPRRGHSDTWYVIAEMNERNDVFGVSVLEFYVASVLENINLGMWYCFRHPAAINVQHIIFKTFSRLSLLTVLYIFYNS